MKPTRSLLPLAVVAALALVACNPAESTGQPEPPVANEAPPAGDPSQAFAAAMGAAKPMTSPREAVRASMQAFMQVRSYHATMTFDTSRGIQVNELDFVAPDRYRMQMAGMGTQLVIGDTMYMSMQGRTMQVPMPKGTAGQWRAPGNFAEAEAGMSAEALGGEDVDGVSARKYVAHHTIPKPADVTLWIGPDELPLKMQVKGEEKGQPVTTTIRYSRFNDPSIVIEPPK